MNPRLDQPLDIPKPDWDRLLKRTAIAMVIVTGIAIATRARSLIILAEVLDVVAILGLLAFATYGLIVRYATKPKTPSDTDAQR